MDKENIECIRYKKEFDGKTYYIFLIPDEQDSSMTNFYMQEDNYGFMSMEMGIYLDKLNVSIEEFINGYFNEWLESYKEEILKLEKNSKLIYKRPRRFGKSMLTSMLAYYYSINEAENFEKIFKGLYIYDHPTPYKNSY